MTRKLAKFMLCALAAVIAFDIQRYRRRAAKAEPREALMTWEAEGGYLPTQE